MQVQTNRARDGLTGAVQSIQVEFAQILKKEGKWVIRPRKLEVVTTYDLEGKRTSQNFHVRAFQDSNEGFLNTIQTEMLLNIPNTLKAFFRVRYFALTTITAERLSRKRIVQMVNCVTRLSRGMTSEGK